MTYLELRPHRQLLTSTVIMTSKMDRNRNVAATELDVFHLQLLDCKKAEARETSRTERKGQIHEVLPWRVNNELHAYILGSNKHDLT